MLNEKAVNRQRSTVNGQPNSELKTQNLEPNCQRSTVNGTQNLELRTQNPELRT
jgi:hypothetical protein